jgi:UDP-N-acetylmuramoylalanine--D-glutamate ligase
MMPVTTFARKTIAVFGLGGSGIVTAKALIAGKAIVAAWDDNPAARAAAEQQNIPLVDLSAAPDWRKFSALVLAPGVALTHPKPHWTVEKARAAKVPIIGDVELFCRERARWAPACPFVAITGTNGKSTTTALLAHLLRQDRRDVQLGGNIGTPILDLEHPAAGRFYVIELSSFQIDLTPSLAPTVGVLINISPDHLDRHGTMENYAAIKERLVKGSEQPCIGVDDDHCRSIRDRLSRGRVVYTFSAAEDYDGGYHLRDGKLCFDDQGLHEDLADFTAMRALRGRHNAQNALAALAALGALGGKLIPAGWNPFLKRDPTLLRRLFENEDDFARRMRSPAGRYVADADATARRRLALQAAFESFPGLAHRMEEVGSLGRVLFINDSKATNADSTSQALATWPRDIFWIAGGRAKEGGIESLRALFPHVAKAYLVGESAETFAATLGDAVPFEHCRTLERAVAASARDAAANSGAEPVVLLSPACASYDQFKNFEVRGDAFRALVEALPGTAMRARST